MLDYPAINGPLRVMLGDIRPLVQECSALPIERFRVVNQFEAVNLSELHRGIIFVFATWSGPARLALRRFTKLLAEFNADSLDLVILDIDCLSAATALQLFGNSGFPAGGNGETIWVRDGVIVAREIAAPGDSEPLLRQHTRDLLDDDRTG